MCRFYFEATEKVIEVNLTGWRVNMRRTKFYESVTAILKGQPKYDNGN